MSLQDRDYYHEALHQQNKPRLAQPVFESSLFQDLCKPKPKPKPLARYVFYTLIMIAGFWAAFHYAFPTLYYLYDGW
jgi:hypothetical protein